MGAVVGMDLVVPASYQWSFDNVAVLESGDHDGQNDNNSTYDRDYQYVPNGVTEQVADGYEDSGWVTAPPAGEGWVQIDQQTVNGNEIPCDDFETKKVTLCHATGSESNPYEKIEVSVSAFFSAGHIDHGGDIYKAFTYVKQGQTYNVGRAVTRRCCSTTNASVPSPSSRTSRPRSSRPTGTPRRATVS